jgi:hypothetical protein
MFVRRLLNLSAGLGTDVVGCGWARHTVTATNSTQVVISNSADNSTFTLAAIGGTQKVTPASTATYTVTATGAGGTATARTTVTIATPGAASPTVTITANPATITQGSSATLTGNLYGDSHWRRRYGDSPDHNYRSNAGQQPHGHNHSQSCHNLAGKFLHS